ncbi:MAG: type 1 glutamine amidotransferase [Actinomycetota bacterium]|nr:type 1 glutamine amidotransferase [Actinomycetota bacterium]
MKVLAVIHAETAGAAAFGEAVADGGHELDEWLISAGGPLPTPIESYDAVLLFGGSMHADQEDEHPWLRDENTFIQRLLELGTPVLGVCLGAQLLAKAAGAAVYRAREPEIGWVPVEVTSDADEDPVFGRIARRFDAFEWHYYTYDVPAGARELARSDVCSQAFRLGGASWGIQFHAEVTRAQIEAWLLDERREPPVPPEELLRETDARIGAWERFGRELCGSFLEFAERSVDGRAARATARPN